jgi:autotransporter translocation and assembly factor TamB
MWRRALQGLAILVPPVLVGIGGWRYAHEVLAFLRAGELPIAHTLETPGGSVRIEAQGYAFDGDELRLDGLVVKGSGAGPILRVDRARLNASRLLATGFKDVRADLDGVDATLRRLSNGKFEFQRYLPPPEGPPPENPFAVRLTRVRVRFADESVRPTAVFGLAAPEALVSGNGDDWRASARVQVETLGLVALEARQVRGRGVVVETEGRGLRLDRLLRYAQSLPETRELKDLRAAKAQGLGFSGRLRLDVPREGQVAVRLDGEAKAASLAVGEWTAAQARFIGTATEAGASGVLEAETPYASARFQGSVLWAKAPSVGGNLQLSVKSSSALPASVRRALPAQVSFSGATYEGWASWNEKAWGIQGKVQAASLAAQGRRFKRVASRIFSDGVSTLAPDLSLDFEGRRIRASAAIDSQQIVAALQNVQVSETDLTLIQPKGLSDLKGLAFRSDLSAIVRGSVQRPMVDLWATGSGRVPLGGQGSLRVPRFEIAAQWDGRTLSARRVYARSDAGVAALTAHVHGDGRIEGRVLAEVPSLAGAFPEVQGTASLDARLSGAAASPRLAGTVRAYGLEAEGQRVPYAQGRLLADRDGVRFEELKAASGTATVDATLAMRLRDQRLFGKAEATGIFLENFIPEDTVRGLMDVQDVRLGGTLRKPTASGMAVVDRLFFGEVSVAQAEGSFRLQEDRFSMPRLSASVAGGTVSGSLAVGLRDQQLEAKVEMKGIQAARLAPVRNLRLGIAAELEGEATVAGTIQNPTFETTGRLADVRVRDASFGNGLWAFSGSPQDFSGEAEVGSLDRYLRVEEVRVEPEAKRFSGTLIAYRNQASDYLEAFRPRLADLDPEAQRLLGQLRAVVDADVAIVSAPDGWSLQARTLNATGIAIGPETLGDLRSAFARQEGRWTVENFVFAGPLMSATLKGFLEEEGDLQLDGEIQQLDADVIARLRPGANPVGARADVSFVASGKTANPEVRGSLFATQGPEGRDRLFLQLAPIEFTPDPNQLGGRYSTLSTTGSIRFRNLEAVLDGQAPWSWSSGFRRNDPLDARLQVTAELLRVDEASDTGLLDPARTKGTAIGTIRIGGTLDEPRTEGDLTVENADVALKGFQTGLTGLSAEVRLRGNRLEAQATAGGTRGGRMDAQAKVDLPNLADLVSSLGRGRLDDLLRSEVAGSIRADQFGILHRDPSFGSVRGAIEADIALKGPLQMPVLAGNAALRGLDLDFALGEAVESQPLVLPIDPRFDLRFELPGSARFRTLSADMRLAGEGTLRGRLVAPELEGDLRVREGTIRLPNARISLDEGGTVRPSFRLGDPQSGSMRVAVDLVGRTRLTASRFAGEVEKFDILLEVRGDLLQENALAFTASSEPPGLSQERILALIGTGDLLDSLSAGFQRARFQQALLNVAIPVFLDGFTEGLAKGLGLDYVGVSFDQQQTATVYVAKTLARGLTLEGSREFAEDRDTGEPVRYDLKLAYRLPAPRRAISRYRLILGRDQITPWKIGVEYSGKFGNVRPADASDLRVISGKRGPTPER